MAKIIPTILTKDLIDLEDKIKKLEGLVDEVQIDVIDGLYLPEKTIDLEALANIETSLKIDIHLMVDKPTGWIERCVNVMADKVIGQIEMVGSQEEFILKAAQTAGLRIGFGLDMGTPISVIAKDSLIKLDSVLIMTRRAGFGEYSFEEGALDKVRELREIGFMGEICVDGGINFDNIRKCVEAGADTLAIGGEIWKANDITQVIERLNNELKN